MSKALAAAICALALIQIATPAVAASNDFADRRIEQLLREILTKDAPRLADPVLVTRAAAIKVVGTIRRAGAFTLPLTCTVTLFDSDAHSEAKSGPVTFTGNVGTCTVNIPFRWTNTDQDGKVDVDVNVANGPLESVIGVAAAPNFISRSADMDLPEIDLPLQGSTTTLSFDIRM